MDNGIAFIFCMISLLAGYIYGYCWGNVRYIPRPKDKQ
jgi:hypothetical protein